MSALAGTGYQAAAADTRPGHWLIVVVTVVVVVLAPVFTILGSPGGEPSGTPVAALPLALAAFSLQVRHGFAVADGRRPRGAAWTVVAVALVSYVPLPWFGWNWSALEMCVMASAPLVVRGRWTAIAVAVPVVATDVAVVLTYGSSGGTGGLQGVIYTVFYETTTLLTGAAALYGSARMVRLVDELRGARTELAAVAVGRERLRFSRDLHDLLGQSLSAIALKGDLAVRLVPRDPVAARAEVDDVAELARDTLRGIRAISRDEHAVSLRTESEGAIALLSAAGVDASVDVDLPGVDPAIERMLAWCLREGVANTLRHSQAHVCTITGGQRDHTVFLEIVNDGASNVRGDGSGLAGLDERARTLSGSVAAVHLPGGRFRLLIEVPEKSE